MAENNNKESITAMNLKEIQTLLSFIAKSGLEEVSIETGDVKLSVKKSCAQLHMEAAPVAYMPQQISAPPMASVSSEVKEVVASSQPSAPAVKGDDFIKSPMIGTFYSSANPESPVLVKVGDKVAKGQIVCIIEAMKLFNEIESDISGTVVKVLVENASPVEYDQALFVIQAD